ncbi:MAG: TonB family protein, partial [Acidobacteria bacterium]|nr:TonB family protein [Acidobacteriota bacterium]
MAQDLLNACLVDGDSEQLKRERKIRRRALGISISLQTIALAAILLMPLLGRPALISWNVVPVPPYYSRPTPHVDIVRVVHEQRPRPTGFYEPTRIPQHINTDPQPPEPVNESVPFDGPGINVPGAIPIGDARATTQPPPPAEPQPKTPKTMHLSHIDASRLVYRMEPIYPVLAKQIGKSGQVELHAMIGEDGAIQSLEAVGGDPMFFASAMQAVKQWRYTPTMLNGQPVKVDT